MTVDSGAFRTLLCATAAALSPFPSVAAETPPASAEKTVIGRVEEVALMPDGFIVRAKIDSGARTSSLNARHYRLFEKDGKKWVSFTVTNRQKVSHEITSQVVRIARIKRIKGKSHERPVIRLRLCIGSFEAETEVNLVDRTGFNYQLLIGRRYMEGHFLIDPARLYTAKPACKPGNAG